MRKFIQAALAVMISVCFSAQTATAESISLPPTKLERDAALLAAKPFSLLMDKVAGDAFVQKGTHWETTRTPAGGQKVTIVIYKQIDTNEVRNIEVINEFIKNGKEIPEDKLEEQKEKGIVNVAFTAPTARMGNYFKFASKGEFGKIMLKNPTTFIISPNSPLKAKQGGVKLKNLPAPLAYALKAIDADMESVKLPTGVFSINQFQPGKSFIVRDVFKAVGLSYPVTSSVSLNAGNYKKLLKGKAGLSLSIKLTEDNAIARLIKLTQVMKTPKDSSPVIKVSTDTRRGSIGVAYSAPYMVLNKGPFDTSLSFKYNRKDKELSGEMSVGIGKIANPVIVPNLIELKGVTMEDTEISLGFEPGDDGLEVSVGLEIGKFTVKGNTFEPVKMNLAMGSKGPLGGMIEIRSKDTIYMTGIADLAELAFNANPDSKIIPAWARTDISEKLRLERLPEIGIRAPHLFIATAGQDDSSHLSDIDLFKDIASAGIRVKGELIAYGQRLTYTDLGLDAVNGLNARSYVKPFKAGIFELKGADLAIHASANAVPYFKLHGGAAINGTTVGELDMELGRNGVRVDANLGCVPPMVRVDIETSGWTKITKGGIRESDCAQQLADAIADAAKDVGDKINETSQAAAAGISDAAGKAAKWSAQAASDAKRFARDAGCAVEDFFTGGNCKSRKARAAKRKAERARDKALKKAAEYRKFPNPASCHGGWYWHPKYRRCMPGGAYKMVYYAQGGAKNGRCMTIEGAHNTNGKPMVLWNCVGQWNQMFRTVLWKDRRWKPRITLKPLNPAFSLINSYGRCVSFDPRKSAGAPIVLWKCVNGPGQKWQYIGGRLVGHKGLCLRLKGNNKNGAKLVADHCSSDTKALGLKATIVKLGKEIKKLSMDLAKKIRERSVAMQTTEKMPQFLKKAAVSKIKRKYDPKIMKMRATRSAKKTRRNVERTALKQHQATKNSKPKVEWVYSYPTQPDPVKTFHKKFNVPYNANLKLGKFCLDKTSSPLPGIGSLLWDCSGKNKNQVFSFASTGNGNQFVLSNKHSKMCLSVTNNKTNTPVVQLGCHFTNSQEWTAFSPGKRNTDANTFKGKFLLRNGHSGLCMQAFGLFQKDYTAQQIRQAGMTKKNVKECNDPKGNGRFGNKRNPLGGKGSFCPVKNFFYGPQIHKKAKLRQAKCNSNVPAQLFTLLK